MAYGAGAVRILLDDSTPNARMYGWQVFACKAFGKMSIRKGIMTLQEVSLRMDARRMRREDSMNIIIAVDLILDDTASYSGRRRVRPNNFLSALPSRRCDATSSQTVYTLYCTHMTVDLPSTR